MTIDTGISLRDIETFLIVVTRIASFMHIAPFFGMTNTPVRVKVGFSIFTAMLITAAIPLELPEYSNMMGYAFLIVKESITGLLIGFSAFMCSSTVLFAGRMIDMEIGMSMATIFDATTKSQASLTGSFYQYLLLAFMIVTNMHHFLLSALVDSYRVIPLGGIRLSGMYDKMLEFFADYFILGFRIVLPIFAVTLLLNIILAILAKVAPQMNMFAVGLQLKVLLGLFVLFLLAGMLPAMADFIFDKMKYMVTSVIKGML